MEKEIIQSMVASIPESLIGDEIESDMIWEETDGGAHFKVYRQAFSNTDLSIIMMSVSGRLSERKRIIEDFVEAFGHPVKFDPDLEPSNSVDIMIWEASSAANHLYPHLDPA